MDSEEEATISSEDEEFDDERLGPNTCSDDCEQMPAAKRAKTVSWSTETDVDYKAPETLRFLPARQPGPQMSPADSQSLLNLFKLFFSESVVSNLCHNTNAQAARAMAKGRKYRWTDVNVDELYQYIGLLFYMATVKVSSIADFWKQDSIFSVPFPSTVMSRDRYRSISWNVHLSDPVADLKRAKNDCLFRVKPLMDAIRLASRAYYHPRRSLAVSERLVPSRANAERKTKLGFKIFVLTDTSNGYTVDFSVYTGKKSFPAGHGISYDAVMSLLDPKVLGSGYHVYMDDFFTSAKLLKDLLAMKFGACGPFRDHRKGFPPNASNSLSEKPKLELKVNVCLSHRHFRTSSE